MKKLSDFVGSHVIIRSTNEGVNFGLLAAAEVGFCILADAQRLHFHKPMDSSQSWYEGVANSGLAPSSSISSSVEFKAIQEDYSITLCKDKAVASILSHPTKESST